MPSGIVAPSYGAESDFVRAQADFTQALALNPDETTKAKIVEALNAVTASAKAADAQSYDPSVITDPSTSAATKKAARPPHSSYSPTHAVAMPAVSRQPRGRRAPCRPLFRCLSQTVWSLYRFLKSGFRFSMKAAMPSF